MGLRSIDEIFYVKLDVYRQLWEEQWLYYLFVLVLHQQSNLFFQQKWNMWGKSSKSTRVGIFFKLQYHAMLFSWMGNMAKPRLQIFGGDQNCLHLRWTIFLFHFYENLQINFWRHPRMKQTSKRHNMKKWLPKPVFQLLSSTPNPN